jgi:SAM-dependent methyltransferase
MPTDTDREWERWGAEDPYYSVLTHSRFRKANLTQEARDEFFASGRVHVDHLMLMCRTWCDASFMPARILDFGCGVGRLLPPLAEIAAHVTGVDVSEAMLAEAERNCAALPNVALVRSDDTLSTVTSTFDLIHSAIVFQHIPARRGTQLFGRLLERLAPGGVGAIQVTYAKTIYGTTLGLPPIVVPSPAVATPKRAGWRRAIGQLVPVRHDEDLRKTSAAVDTKAATPAADPAADPEMQMNSYHLNLLLFQLQAAGISALHLEFTDHGGELGVFLYFKKPAL